MLCLFECIEYLLTKTFECPVRVVPRMISDQEFSLTRSVQQPQRWAWLGPFALTIFQSFQSSLLLVHSLPYHVG